MLRKVSGSCRFRALPGSNRELPGEQRPEAADRGGGARVRPDLGDHRMENAEVACERLEVEGGGDVGFPEQPFGGEFRQRGPAGGEGVVVDERQPFVVREDEAGLVKQPLREVGHGAEVSLAHRAEAAHGRHQITVEGVDHHLGQLGADTGHALGEAVHQADHRGPHDGRRGRRPLGNEVTPDQEPAEALAGPGVKHDALPFRQSGRQAVDGGLRPQRLVDDLPGGRHPVARRRGEGNLIAPLSNGSEGIDRE